MRTSKHLFLQPARVGADAQAFFASSRWYDFHPGHHFVCQRQILLSIEFGFFSARILIAHVSHLLAISRPPFGLVFEALQRSVGATATFAR